MNLRKSLRKTVSIFLSLLIVFTALLQIPTEANASSAIELQMYNTNTGATTSTISPNFRLKNIGTETINLSTVKIRYYYTKDNSAVQNFVCDYSTAGTGNVIGTFYQMPTATSTADTYLEISFTSGTIAAGGSVDIQTRIHNAEWSNYSQANDYSFNASNTTYIVNDKATAYIGSNLLWGTEPISSKEKFLIVVSSSIYDLISTELQTYINDVYEDGYNSTVIRVNNKTDPLADYVCSTAYDLKNVIRNYYNQGYAGFVFIGSHPEIQTAYWTSDLGENACKITDCYFADVDSNSDGISDYKDNSWVDRNSDGIYEVSAEMGGEKIPLITPPDMFYGRIDAGGMYSTAEGQAQEINNYLIKLHCFRQNRAVFQSQDKKALGFVDDDWRSGRGGDVTSGEYNIFNSVFPHMKVVEEKMASNIDTLDAELHKVYYFEHIVTHGGDNFLQPRDWEDGFVQVSSYDISQLINIGPDLPAAYYIHSYGCSTSRYVDPHYNPDTHTSNPENILNMGEAYLFGNANTVNVTGVCDSIYSPLDEDYFKELSDMSIGKAYKNWISRWYAKDSSPSTFSCPSWECIPCYVLLGDPTLKHPLNRLENKCPALASDISNLQAKVGEQFTLPLSIKDPENDNVTVTMSAAPIGALLNSATNTITWTPVADQVGGKGQKFELVLTDTAGNTYTEEFNVYVLPQDNNLGFETLRNGQLDGWKTVSCFNSSEFSFDNSLKHTGSYSARITSGTIDHSRFRHTVAVTPHTNYHLSGYIKTEDVVNCENGEKGANLRINLNGTIEYIKDYIVGDNDWTYVDLDFNSGDCSLAGIECSLGSDGNVCTGTAWFDDITLEPAQ